jgi:glutamate racemase
MIGIFDSGIGGLSVVKELLRRHPDAGFAYLGDTARTPYGNKSRDTIQKYATEDVEFLLAKGATHIIIACNTVSSTALEALKEKFPDVVFFDVVHPTVDAALKRASEITGRKAKIGVIGTRATIGSRAYERLLQAGNTELEIIQASCPLFVPLVEENYLKRPETKKIVRNYLADIRQKQVDALILGCTHYPFLADLIRDALQKRVKIIDSPSALIDSIERTHPEILEGKGAQSYYFTDPSPRVQEIAQGWLRSPLKIERADL